MTHHAIRITREIKKSKQLLNALQLLAKIITSLENKYFDVLVREDLNDLGNVRKNLASMIERLL